jgi:hypothetical protein
MADENNSSDKDGAFQRLLDRYKNDGIAMAEKLFSENYAYRTQIRDLERQVLEVQSKAPAEGAIVLTGNDAQTWAAYQALGKPDELKQGLEEKTQLQGKLQNMERETTLRTVAETVGYKAGVLANLDKIAKAEGKALSFDVRETTVDGKTVKAAYVKDGDKELPLTEYATTNWADFIPALTVQGTQQQSGTRYPAQHAGNGAGGKTDPVEAFLQRQEASRAAVKNPLLKE